MMKNSQTPLSPAKHGRLKVLFTAGILAVFLLSGCRTGRISDSSAVSDPDSGPEAAGAVEASTGAGAAAQADTPAAGGDLSAAGADAAQESSTAAGSAFSSVVSEGMDAAAQDAAFSAEGKNLLIVLDPGHSSQVPGTDEPIGPGSSEMKEADTVGTYGQASALHEYELTMMVSQKLRTELEARGYIVKFTHVDTTRAIGCVERAEVANNNRADAFLRIHANGSTDPATNGAMAICITKDNPYHPELYSASARLAELLLTSYCEQTGIARESVWETDTMAGNNWSEVPAVMIELGYMTNPDEDLNMAQDSLQLKMANAMADALDQWFARMPEEELSMHPRLTGNSTAGSTSDHADPAAADPSSADAADASGSESGSTSQQAAPGADSSDNESSTPSEAVDLAPENAAVPTGVPAGTSGGAGAAVPAGSSGAAGAAAPAGSAGSQ